MKETDWSAMLMDDGRIRSWRLKAEELRTAAESMKDPTARRGMLNAAASYDALAEDAEARYEGRYANERRAGR